MQTRKPAITGALFLIFAYARAAQANGHLQIRYLNVRQGDAALIISPLGETMLIDSGPFSASNCASATGIITPLNAIGLTHLDYHVASHYDADHIGCTDHEIAHWPILKAVYDRGTVNPPSTATYNPRYDLGQATAATHAGPRHNQTGIAAMFCRRAVAAAQVPETRAGSTDVAWPQGQRSPSA